MLSNVNIFHVDAFTSEPFRGNPAGVCILNNEPASEWMQNIAMELNLSETAFIISENGTRKIKFFTPQTEVPLCGHATLSAAHILYESKYVSIDEEINFLSKAGELKAVIKGSWITLNFPAYPVEQTDTPEDFKKVTGVEAIEFYKSAFGWSLALIGNEKLVREMKPDFRLLKNSDFSDLIVTSRSEESGFDFCVRCFAPGLGIDEDPVTGSAHCALAPFWFMKTGKTTFISHQVSKRTGVLKVSLESDRVNISGQARTIFKADLLI